jgi:tripartite-type tricarboxylate transporter receptor subunit TctC
MRRWSFALCGVILQTFATPVLAQDYPNRPIRVIVTTSPGGISDVFLRALAGLHQRPAALVLRIAPAAT